MRLGLVSLMELVPWGGSEELWAEAVGEALREDVEVLLCLKGWPQVPPRVREFDASGAQLHLRRYPRATRATRLLQRVGVSPASRDGRVLRQFSADVFCISQGGTFDFLRHPWLMQFLGESGTPYVVISQYNDDLALSRVAGNKEATEFLERAERVAFVSKRNLCEARRQLAAHLANAVVVCNPLRLEIAEALPWPQCSKTQFACVARLTAATKGQDILFEILGQDRWARRDWQLNLYGEGNDGAYLERLARFYGISNRVTFHGQQTDIPGVWAANHLLLMPSRGEGTPLALIEAMACGRAAVVTDVGGNAEWVVEGHNGFVAEAPTVPLFEAALERAWQRRDDWEMLGHCARSTLCSKLDPRPGRTLLEILRAAASGRHRSFAAHSRTAATSGR